MAEKVRRIGGLLVLLLSVKTLFGLNGFLRLGVNEGLSQSTVADIFQDSKGRLWITTADGLNWYDGREFHVFRNRNKVNDLTPSNYFSGSVYEDDQGRLWSGTRSGICYFVPDSGIFHSVVIPDAVNNGKPRECRVIGIDGKNTVYFHSSAGEILTIDNGSRLARIRLKLPAEDPVYKSYFISDTEFFLALRSGIVRVDAENFKLRKTTFDTNASGMISDCCIFKNDIYISASAGCWKWDTATDTFTRLFSGDVCEGAQVGSIAADSNYLYVGTLSCGIFRVDVVTGTIIEHFNADSTNPSSLPLGSVKCLMIDHMGNFWSGIEGTGICLYDLNRKPFRLYRNGLTAGMKFSTDYIKSILVRNNDEIWLGTYEGGLVIYDRKNDLSRVYDILNLAAGLPENSISHIHEDGRGRIWLALSSGIFLVGNDDVGSLKKMPLDRYGPENMNCRQIISLSDGRIVVASDWGLYALNEDRMVFESIQDKVSVHAVFEDSERSIWVGGYYGYVYRFKWMGTPEGNVLTATDSLFEGYNARDFVENRTRGSIYMATEKGVAIYELSTGHSSLLNADNGLSNEFIYSVFFDRNNLLWATSNKGLMSINLNSGEILNYDTDDGLQAMEFNTRALFQQPNGEFFLGGVSGFNSFFPNEIRKNKNIPLPFLTELKIKDQYYPLNYLMHDTPIVLNYQMNGLSFSFSNSDYSGTKKSCTAFFLEGNDNEWTVTPAISSYRLESLKPGAYTLRLKAMNADGLWGPEVVVCRFIIATPFWLTWWFSALIILFVILISALVVRTILRARYRRQLQVLEQQRRIQNLRLQISHDIHDDIGSGLSRIALMGQLHERDKDASYIQKISETAREMTSQLSQIVWSLNPENDDVPSLILYLSDLAYRFFEGTGTEIHFSGGSGWSDFKLDPRQRVNLVKCFRESLNNALKYAGARNITISITHDSSEMLVCISDDGTGFSEGTVRGGGNGLRIMERRMMEIGGSFDILSAPGKGTVVTLKFPITTKV